MNGKRRYIVHKIVCEQFTIRKGDEMENKIISSIRDKPMTEEELVKMFQRDNILIDGKMYSASNIPHSVGIIAIRKAIKDKEKFNRNIKGAVKGCIDSLWLSGKIYLNTDNNKFYISEE